MLAKVASGIVNSKNDMGSISTSCSLLGTSPSALPIQEPNACQRVVARPQWREAMAGACAGAFSRTLLAPVERVKLLQQLQGSTRGNPVQNSNSGGGLLLVTPLKKLTAMQLAQRIYRDEGILAFWRGNWPNVLRVSGTSALHFTCMDYFKQLAAAAAPTVSRTGTETAYSSSDMERRRKIITSFVSGGLAGATATTILYPIEFLRTRLAMDLGKDDWATAKAKAQPPPSSSSSTTTATMTGRTAAAASSQKAGLPNKRQYRGMMDVLRSIIRSDGLLGLYQGFGIALVGGVVYRILLLGGYDAWKYDLLYRKQQKQQNKQQRQTDNIGNNGAATELSQLDLSWSERMAVAQTVSLVAGTFTYPLDSIRRRMMMQAGATHRLYRNSIHCAILIFQKEGMRGFYLGIGPNLVRSVGTALLLVGYDRVRTLL